MEVDQVQAAIDALIVGDLRTYRKACASLRGTAYTESILKSLRSLANSSEERPRLLAVRGLGALVRDSPSALQQLSGFLQDPSAHVRMQTLSCLGRYALNGQEVVPALIAALEQNGTTGGIAALRLLGRYGQAAAPGLRLLVNNLDSDDVSVRWHSAACILQIGPAAARWSPQLVLAAKRERSSWAVEGAGECSVWRLLVTCLVRLGVDDVELAGVLEDFHAKSVADREYVLKLVLRNYKSSKTLSDLLVARDR